MEKKVLILEAGDRTPYINFDSITGIMQISGRSIMENSKMFYEPIIEDWFEEYMKCPAEKTSLNIKFEYFNTSTSIWIFQLIKKMDSLFKASQEVEVNWFYEDEDIYEAGEDYQPLTTVPFNFIDAMDE